jgi:hypothetical protein
MDPQQQHAYTPAPEQAGNGLAIAGMVLGILGLLLCWIPGVGWLLALLGIIFGAIGMSKANKIGGKGKGMAVAGLVIGVVGLLAGIILFVMALMVISEEEKRLRRQLRGDVMAPYTEVYVASATNEMPRPTA